MRKLPPNYNYELKTSMEIKSSSTSGMFVRLRGISLEIESNFPMTKGDLQSLKSAVAGEIEKRCGGTLATNLCLGRSTPSVKEKPPRPPQRSRR